MEFKELENKVMQNALNYGKEYGLDIDQDFALFKLYEEIGELAQAVLIHRKKSRPEKHVDEKTSKQMVAEEIADVVGMAMVTARLFEIDLEKTIDSKWIKREKYENFKNV